MVTRDLKGRFVKGGESYWKGKTFSEEYKQKLSIAKLGKKADLSNAWKGGKYKDRHGYIYVYSPNHPYRNFKGYVFEHRLVMEKAIGRYLIPNVDDVHHIDGNKINNELSNLELLSHGEHSTLTHTKKPN